MQKGIYYLKLSTKLSYLKISPKAFWLILKSFLNDKKICIILPTYHNDKFVTDFKQQAEFFYSFFTEQCSMIQNRSKHPTDFVTSTDQFHASITFS